MSKGHPCSFFYDHAVPLELEVSRCSNDQSDTIPGAAKVEALSSIQLASTIQQLSHILADNLAAAGFDVVSARKAAQAFTRRLAGIFYVLDVQGGEMDLATPLGVVDPAPRSETYELSLRSLLPELIRLCSEGCSEFLKVSTPLGEQGLRSDSCRRRLLILARIIADTQRLTAAGKREAQGVEPLAERLIYWARGESAAAILQTGLGRA